MTDERIPYTADDLRAIADVVETWSAHLYQDDGDPVLEVEEIKLNGSFMDRPGADAGRIVVDHSGAYWGWIPE